MKSACVRGSSPAVSLRYGRGSQTELSKHLFVHRALRQSVRELCVDDRCVSAPRRRPGSRTDPAFSRDPASKRCTREDRKSTRLNSSHITISYAVFCLKKKNKSKNNH